MDIFQILKNDHQTVKDLFEQLEGTGASAAEDRENLFLQLKTELEGHSHGEEVVFYPALREHEEMQEMIDHATKEHGEVATFLEEMEELDQKSEEWSTKLAELQENVLQHVKEEEGEMFIQAKALLEMEELQTLGEEFQEAKKQAATD